MCVSIYNTRSFTLSDSLGVYSYPLSFGSQTRRRLQLELKSVQRGRESGQRGGLREGASLHAACILFADNLLLISLKASGVCCALSLSLCLSGVVD